MPIQIPVDVHLVAVTVMNRSGPRPVLDHEIDCGLNVGHVQEGISLVNRIWAPDFQFNMRTIDKVRSNLPGDNDVIGDPERFFLYGQYPARSGISLIAVRQIGRLEHLDHESGNLMYPSAQRTLLTPAQRQKALASPLAQRFRAWPGR